METKVKYATQPPTQVQPHRDGWYWFSGTYAVYDETHEHTGWVEVLPTTLDAQIGTRLIPVRRMTGEWRGPTQVGLLPILKPPKPQPTLRGVVFGSPEAAAVMAAYPEPEPKRCPCCDGRAVVEAGAVRCEECGLSMPRRADAVKLWNKRVEEDDEEDYGWS